MGPSFFGRRTLACLALTALASTSTHAQQTSEADISAPDMTAQWLYTFSLDNVSIDADAIAETQAGIDDGALNLGFEAEYFFSNRLSMSLGFSFLSYDDNEAFRQRTEDQYGNRDNSKSDASAIPLYAEFGYKHFFAGQTNTYLTARAGLSTFLSSERSIANCSNCYEEDIDINGGLYGALGAGVLFGETWGMGLIYKNYFSGDLENSIGVTLSFGY